MLPGATRQKAAFLVLFAFLALVSFAFFACSKRSSGRSANASLLADLAAAASSGPALRALPNRGNGILAIIFGVLCAVLTGTLAAWIQTKITGQAQGTWQVWAGSAGGALLLGLIAWRFKLTRLKILLLILCIGGGFIWYGKTANSPPAFIEKIIGSAKAADTAYAKVTSNALNMRKEPSGSADIVKALKKDDILTVTGVTSADGWVPVEHDGAKGYVSSQYILPVSPK
jgi:hypothetical protein